jgi:hypothetical protein
MQTHQTYQTPSWNQVMSNLNAFVNPQPCPACGRTHAPGTTASAAAPDWLSQWNEHPLVKEWNRAWGAMLDPLVQGMKPAAGHPQQPPHHQPHHHDAAHEHQGCGCSCSQPKGGCSCCQPDDCHCRCCVVNAHLLVYARFGESRVVPITIENNLRREREVELELSDWVSSSKQGVQVAGHVLPETKFTLKPCEERTVVVAVRVTGDPQAPHSNQFTRAFEGAAEQAPDRQVPADLKRERLPDVDSCTVFYADLRVKGCDILPVRIAIAILPRDCDAYKIDCRCGCCC